jgi:protein-S-isoprenylcysteine O-methyltransferase Ste14
MLKILIFFIFSLIMLKFSWPDIEAVPQPSSVIASDSRERDNLYIFQRFMRLLRSLYSRAMTLLHILFSDTHGRKFYRFFGFEFLFLLILVNFGEWLKNPFTLYRMITWMILCSSFLLAGFGIHHLLEYGKPPINGNPEAIPDLKTSGIYKYIRHYLYRSRILLGIETTTSLVTSGIYKYIRHPLYSSMIILGAITLLKTEIPSLLATSLFSVGTVFLYATARIEEKENLLKFGQDYAAYIKQSKMFFSFSISKKS